MKRAKLKQRTFLRLRVASGGHIAWPKYNSSLIEIETEKTEPERKSSRTTYLEAQSKSRAVALAGGGVAPSF